MNAVAKVAIGAGVAYAAYRMLRKEPVLDTAAVAHAADQVAQGVNAAAQTVANAVSTGIAQATQTPALTAEQAATDAVAKGIAQAMATAPALALAADNTAANATQQIVAPATAASDVPAAPTPPLTQAEVEQRGQEVAAQAANEAAQAQAASLANNPAPVPAVTVSPVVQVASTTPTMTLPPEAVTQSTMPVMTTPTAVAMTAVDGKVATVAVPSASINTAVMAGRLSGALAKAVGGPDPYTSAAAFETLSEDAKSVLLRGFAADYVAAKAIDEPGYTAALRASTVSGLPIAWTQMLVARGVSPQQVERVALALLNGFETELTAARNKPGQRLDLVGLRQTMFDKFAPLPPGATMGCSTCAH